ncbi:hypothetical protein FOZ61_009315 [Perkinsus olseni]|uniref:Uncharacterized protein n=1 Tax=Perkinsus olseni TaxID=32597 RepID=A0A7J6M578_PEROL|nr:hypothetical protein FOZ61_009315 [Perkinsus olseni]
MYCQCGQDHDIILNEVQKTLQKVSQRVLEIEKSTEELKKMHAMLQITSKGSEECRRDERRPEATREVQEFPLRDHSRRCGVSQAARDIVPGMMADYDTSAAFDNFACLSFLIQRL